MFTYNCIYVCEWIGGLNENVVHVCVCMCTEEKNPAMIRTRDGHKGDKSQISSCFTDHPQICLLICQGIKKKDSPWAV